MKRKSLNGPLLWFELCFAEVKINLRLYRLIDFVLLLWLLFDLNFLLRGLLVKFLLLGQLENNTHSETHGA